MRDLQHSIFMESSFPHDPSTSCGEETTPPPSRDDLVYGLIDPNAMLAEICHLGRVYIIERRTSDHIDDRPSRSGKGHAPRVQRTLCLGGTRNNETGKRNGKMLQTFRLLLQPNQGPAASSIL